jgi:thiamine pyrophosphokinase
MHIVIFAGGDTQPGKAVSEAVAQADLVIAADSGAATAIREYHCTPSIIVGDLDSLDADILSDLLAQGSQLIQVQVEKDETDTELAIDTAIRHGATEITLLGGLGGMRVEHSIANIFLLTAYPHITIRIIDGPSICWILYGPGQTQITGQQGDLLSLFPINAHARGITTSNLYYPLNDSTLYLGKPRGISNVLLADQANVALQEGILFIVHTSVSSQP